MESVAEDVSPDKSEGRRAPLALALVAFAILWVYWPAASLQGTFYFEDFKHYAARWAFTSARLRAGEFPLWNPYLAFGAPHLAAYYLPLDLLVYTLPFNVAINYAPLLHLFLGGAGLYVLARGWGQSVGAATLGACVYSLGGFPSVNLQYLDIIVATGWYPWILYGVDRSLATGRVRPMALTSIALGLQICGGHPQMVGFGAGLTALYACGWWSTRRTWSAAGQGLRVFGFVHLLGSGLAAVFLIPFLELLAWSGRAGGLSLGRAVTFSLAPEGLLGFVLPFVSERAALSNPFASDYGSRCTFVGLLPLALVPLGLLGTDWRRRVLVIAAIFALGASLGADGPFYPFLFVIPPLSMVRVPARLLWLAGMAVAIIAGFGLDRLRSPRCSARRGTSISSFMLLVVLSTLFFYLGSAGPFADLLRAPETRVWGSVASALAAFSVLWLPKVPRLPPGAVVAAALGVTLCELAVFALSIRTNRVVSEDLYVLSRDTASLVEAGDPHARIYPEDAPIEWVLAERRGDLVFARISAALLRGTLPARFSVRSSEGQVVASAGLEAFRYTLASQDPTFRRDRAWELGRMGVRYVLSPAPLPGRLLRELRAGTPIWIYENPLAAPRAVFTCPTEDLRRMWTLSASPKLGLRTPDKVEGCSGSASIVNDEAERVVVRAGGPTRGYLLLADTHYPGWVATVNGKRVRILAVDHLIRAVPLPPGENRVEFTYRPASVAWGLGLSLASAIVLGVLLHKSSP